MDPAQIDQVLDKLIRDVESSVHSFYRGDVRQHTQRIKTDTLRNEARQSLITLAAGRPSQVVDASMVGSAAAALEPDEVAAAMRCVMAWMPMGPPSAASPQSKCVSAAREMTPMWGEREKARAALKRAAV